MLKTSFRSNVNLGEKGSCENILGRLFGGIKRKKI